MGELTLQLGAPICRSLPHLVTDALYLALNLMA
jgi:hypothetical protein